MKSKDASQIQGLGGLEALLKSNSEKSAKGLPPVHLWNPPFCGEIGLKIAADGTWYYQGSPIGRKAMVQLFSTVLRKDDDGQHYLVTPGEKIGIEVEDAPFTAVEMFRTGEGVEQAIAFRTNVDDIVPVDKKHGLRFVQDPKHQGLKPYILVRGRLEALVSRALYYDLVEISHTHTMNGTDYLGIWSANCFFPMSRVLDLEDHQ
jgi:hypothetical protein